MAALDLDNPLTADADAFGESRLVKLELPAPLADDGAEVSGGTNEHDETAKMSTSANIIICRRSLTIENVIVRRQSQMSTIDLQSEIFSKPCEPAHTMISRPWGIYAPLVPLRPGGSDAESLVCAGLHSRSHNCQSGAGAGLPQELCRVREGARTRSRRRLHS